MACTIDPRHIRHDRLRWNLMSARLRMWNVREQPDGFPEARDDPVALTRVVDTFLAAHDHHEQLRRTTAATP